MPKVNSSKSILEEAYTYYQKGEQKKAIELFDRILSIQSQNPLAFRTEGILLINLERFSESISYFDNILKNNPHDNEILYRKGIVLEMVGKYEDALVCYDKVLSKDQQNTFAYRKKAILLINLERFSESISYFDNILKNDPHDNEILFSKAIALELLGKNEESVPLYLKALKIKHEDTKSMVNFIFYFLNALRISWDPMEFYERLIDNSPNEPFAEFFKQFIKNEKLIEMLYNKYLHRVPELDEIKYWQIKIFEKNNSDFLEDEMIKSTEASTFIQGKKYEKIIKQLFKKYLDRWDVKPEEINYFAQQIVRGKSIKEIEEEFKNSDEFKKLPYWQSDE